MTNKEFIENVYEIAFGDEYSYDMEDYTHEEILRKLQENSEASEQIQELDDSIYMYTGDIEGTIKAIERKLYIEDELQEIVKELQNFTDYGTVPSQYNDSNDMIEKITSELDELSTSCHKALQGV